MQWALGAHLMRPGGCRLVCVMTMVMEGSIRGEGGSEACSAAPFQAHSGACGGETAFSRPTLLLTRDSYKPWT